MPFPEIRQAHQMRAHARHELTGLERFRDVVVAAHLESAHALLDVAFARHENDRRKLHGRVLAHSPAEFEAVELGHHHVHDDQVRQLLFDHRQCAPGLAAVRAHEARAAQTIVDQRRVELVVDDRIFEAHGPR